MIKSYFKKQGKNKKAKFTQKTKLIIYERDNFKCINCDSADIDNPHHVFYGIEAEYEADRNDASNGVTLCIKCHHRIHHTGDRELREKCKQYLLNNFNQ